MNSLSAILICFISTLPRLIGGQMSCTKAIYVGNSIDNVTIPSQNAHGPGQSVVVYSPEFSIPCACGVIAGWQLVRYDSSTDGCSRIARCDITLIAYRNLTLGPTFTAAVVGTYAADLNSYMPASPPSKPYIWLQMPQSEWIPVKYGDYLGWSGQPGSVVYLEEACGGSCPSGLPSTNKFLFAPHKSVTAGSTMTFKNGPVYSYPYNRYYGFRAIVYEGTSPYFSNMPQTISIVDATPVGTAVFKVIAVDGELKQILTYSIQRSCPRYSYFTIDPLTGAIVVSQSLVGPESVHVLTIEVSDDCLRSTSYITIQILTSTTISPNTSTTPRADVLESGPGYGLIAAAAISCLVAIGTSVGVCFFCAQLSDLKKQLDHVKGVDSNTSGVGGRKGDARFLYNGTEDIRTEKGDAKFLYNRTEDFLKDRTLRSRPDSNLKAVEQLTASSNKGSSWTSPHNNSSTSRTRIPPYRRPASPASINMSTAGPVSSV